MRKRGRLLLLIILLAVAALLVSLWVGEGPLWRWVMLRRVPLENTAIEDHDVVGWLFKHRWSGVVHGRVIGWYDNGFLAGVAWHKHGSILRLTNWNYDGSVLRQKELRDGRLEMFEMPPWRWDVTDQTEPSAPWWGKE